MAKEAQPKWKVALNYYCFLVLHPSDASFLSLALPRLIYLGGDFIIKNEYGSWDCIAALHTNESLCSVTGWFFNRMSVFCLFCLFRLVLKTYDTLSSFQKVRWVAESARRRRHWWPLFPCCSYFSAALKAGSRQCRLSGPSAAGNHNVKNAAVSLCY